MKQIDIRVSELSHRYGRTHALKSINLHIQPGEFVSLVGVSGCGKSTLMRLIAGLQTATEGGVWLDGQPPAAARAAKQIGWMAQQAALLPWRTVREMCGWLKKSIRNLEPTRHILTIYSKWLA